MRTWSGTSDGRTACEVNGMVDSERRNAIFKIGAGLGIIGGIGAGGYHTVKAVAGEYEEHQEARPPRPERWADDAEEDIRNGGMGDGLHWEQTYVDVDAVDVTYEQTGTTDAGAPRYRFTAEAPLTDVPFALCDYADATGGDDEELAGILERDSLKLYEELFDTLGSYLGTNTDPSQPAVSTLAVRYVDGTGTAGFAIDDETAAAIAIDGAFAPEIFRDRTNFLQPYRARFTARCGDGDGG